MEIKKIYNKIDKIINKQDSDVMKTLEEIKRELETEIITGGKINNNLKTAFNRLVKKNNIRPEFQKVLQNDNVYSITNGFFLVSYNAKQLPEQLKAYILPENNKYNFNYERLKNTNSVIKLSLNWDSLIKIHKYNKLNKKEDTFTLLDGFTFNIQYFLDIITLLGYKDLSKDIELEYYPENLTTPMNIISKNGNAILLPIRTTEEQIENALNLQDEILNV